MGEIHLIDALIDGAIGFCVLYMILYALNPKNWS